MVAQVAIFFHRFEDHLLEFGGQVVIQAHGRDWIFVQDGVKDCAGGFALERERAGDHFVEHDAEGEEVGARIEVFAENLLGRHVGDRAHGSAGAGELRGIHSDGEHGGAAAADGFRAGDFG